MGNGITGLTSGIVARIVPALTDLTDLDLNNLSLLWTCGLDVWGFPAVAVLGSFGVTVCCLAIIGGFSVILRGFSIFILGAVGCSHGGLGTVDCNGRVISRCIKLSEGFIPGVEIGGSMAELGSYVGFKVLSKSKLHW